MLKKDFKQNLIDAISELGVNAYSNTKFIVIPVVEEGKKLNSTDDWMRLGILNKENLGDHHFSLDVVADMLSGPDSKFPLWVSLTLLKQNNNEYLIELKTSLRFRTPSVLQNQDTGHPPFKVINNIHNK